MTATVFREGHDAVGASVALTAPDGAVTRTRMRRFGARAGPLGGDGHPDVDRRLDVLRRGLERPLRHLGARGRGEDPARAGRRSWCARRGRGCWSAAARWCPPTPSRCWTRPRSPPCATPTWRASTGSPPALADEVHDLLHAHPLRELVSPSPAQDLWVDRERALYGSWYEFFPRSEGADVDVTPPRSGTFRTAAGAAARGRRDGLRHRLPAADPPDRHRVPQGPEQHPHARPARPRLALGDRLRRGWPRRDPPGPRHGGGLRGLRRADPRARHGGRPGPRAAGLPRPPLGQRAPRVVHRAGGRLDRLRREPAEEVPGHLPGQLRPRPRGHLRRGAADRAAVGLPRASRCSGSTTRTPSRCSSGSG